MLTIEQKIISSYKVILDIAVDSSIIFSHYNVGVMLEKSGMFFYF